jgi:predicted RNA binding protein YcfA (HicA-like mRNA interferase family)
MSPARRGSHIILVKEGHIATLSIPNHPEVARGTLRSLVARAGIALDDFLKALKS